MKRTLFHALCFVSVFLLLACSDDSAGQSPDGDASIADGDLEISEQEGEDGEETEDAEDTPMPPPYDYCNPPEPPDNACYKEKRAPDSELIALAKEIMAKQIADNPPEALNWNWEEAVMMLAIAEMYRVTGEQSYQDYYKAWMDFHMEEGYEMLSSDSCAPAAIALRLYEQTGEEKYRGVVEDALHYLYEVALRTEEGGINHLGTTDYFGITLWVDSLFMFGNVLIGWGELEDDKAALDEYSFQFSVFSDLLQKEGGFFKHAYQWKGNQDEGIFWGRGNGWVLAAGSEYLRVLRNRGERDETVEQAFYRLSEAAIQSQDTASGLWWTVLNKPEESYLETSASALFAFGLARGYRYGYFEEDVVETVENAVKGVLSKITRDEEGRPVVQGVSDPTTAGTFEYYANLGTTDDITYGLGAVLFMLIETSGLVTPEAMP